MKREWSAEELGEQWSLSRAELEAVGNKTGPTRLGLAVLLKYFQLSGHFPERAQQISLRPAMEQKFRLRISSPFRIKIFRGLAPVGDPGGAADRPWR